MSSYYDGIIGQEKAKVKLSLYVDSFKATGLLPNLLLEGPFGSGKSIFARQTAKATGKAWKEVNGATVLNVKSFMNQVLMDMVGKRCLLFLDELHAVPKPVFDLLLSITNPTASNRNIIFYEGSEIEFDLSLISFIFATTERQKVFKPLLSRLTSVSLTNYDECDLAEIILDNVGSYTLSPDAALELATYTRGAGRDAMLMGREVTRYCSAKNLTTFPDSDIQNMMSILDIYPNGLSEQEVIVLTHIRDSNGGISLTALSSKTMLTKEAQQDMELYLQRHGLMKIDGTRQITPKGITYLKNIGR